MPLPSPSRPSLISYLRAFWPARQAISAREKWRASVGAALGILLVGFAAAYWLEGRAAAEHGMLALALVAPIGASAVLVFAVPSSPLAQPWSVLGGNTLSALVGIACAKWVLDVSRDDLQALLEQAEASAYQRKMGELRCADVMSPAPIAARQEMPLREAWALMRKHKIKALPVIDRQNHLLGIVTVADFMQQIDLDAHEGVGWHLRALLRQTRKARPVNIVGDIMTRTVRVASSDRLLIDLVPVFSENGHRHIPIIDAQRHLVGIITQSDLIKALYAAVRA